jgi:hypothetical protein
VVTPGRSEPRGGGQRQAEANEVVRRIADHGLVEVADLDGDLALRIGDRPQVADMAIAANPDRRTVGNEMSVRLLEPLVEIFGGAAHIGMGRARHLQALLGEQPALPLGNRGIGRRAPRHTGERSSISCCSMRSWS